jgi:hypothetical protein
MGKKFKIKLKELENVLKSNSLWHNTAFNLFLNVRIIFIPVINSDAHNFIPTSKCMTAHITGQSYGLPFHD